MSFSDNILEQAERYLDGKMTAEELKIFEKEIENNEELLNYIEVNKQMRLQYGEEDWGFAKNTNESDKLKTLEAVFNSEDTKKTKDVISKASQSYFNNTEEITQGGKSGKYKIYFTLTIAACIALMVGFFITNQGQTTSEIYASYSSWSELPSLTERGESQNILLYKGEQAFQAKNYKEAEIAFIEAIKKSNNFDANAMLYLGIAQLELNEYEAALSNFKKVTKSDSLDASKGYWYTGLTYLKQKAKVKAIETFELIAANATYYNNDKAKTILEALK